MKRKKKLLSLLTAALLGAVAIMPGVGTFTSKAVANYKPVSGTNTTLTKYLVIPQDANVPNLTFRFTVEPGAGDGTGKVYAGDADGRVLKVNEDKPYASVADVSFTPEDSTTAGGTTIPVSTDDQKYATKETTIDFSNTKFSEPGVYRYSIKELDTAGATAIGGNERTLDVYVIDENNAGVLSIGGYVIFTKKDEEEVKTPYFTNQWPSNNLYIGKKIAGNQASKDKYFMFTVELTGAGKGTVISVGGDYTQTAISNNVNGATTGISEDYTNPQTLKTDADGSVRANFYLQGDQYINLMGIPKGAHYKVTEADYSDDGYTGVAASAADGSFVIGEKNFNGLTESEITDADVYTGYKNSKSGAIPTGVILSVAPWVIAGAVIICGIVFFVVRSRKKYDAE